jgi:hypothetical protein
MAMRLCQLLQKWVAFAADVNADPLSQINVYVLQLGSWRCCLRCLKGETASGSNEKEYGMQGLQAATGGNGLQA